MYYYAVTVSVTAVKPLSTSDAAVEPSAVSVIVPLLSVTFAPPSVNTSSSATVCDATVKRFLFAVDPVAV